MNATFETALDFMDDDMLETLERILALPVPLAMIASGGEGGPPGAFILIPQVSATQEQATQVMAAYRSLGEPENLTPEDRSMMALAVAERLHGESDEDDEDE